MRKLVLFFTCLYFFGFLLNAQNNNREIRTFNVVEDYFSRKDTGVITIINDPRLDTLIDRYILSMAELKGLRGYRIQIYFGSGRNAREDANTTKANCIFYFPEQKVYVLYQSPFYKVRVGDFRTRNEAYIWYKKIIGKFPQAYIVNDIINFPEL